MKILVCTGCSKEVITFTNDFNFHFFNFGIIMCSEECYNKMSGLHNTKKYIITCRGCSMKTTIWQINEDVSISLLVQDNEYDFIIPHSKKQIVIHNIRE